MRGAGSPADSNRIVASLLERHRPTTEVRLRGIVDTGTAAALSILGVTVQINASTNFADEGETPMTADAFFAAAQGRIVSAKGTLNGGIFTPWKSSSRTTDRFAPLVADT